MRIIEIPIDDIEILKIFLNSNKKLEAIKYIIDTYELSLRDANKVVKKIIANPGLNVIKIEVSQNFQREVKDSLYTKTSKISTIMYYLLLFVGLCLLVGGIYNLGKTLNSLAQTEKTSATIIRYESHLSVTNSDNRKIIQTMYNPVMQFTFRNKIYERKTKTSSSSKDFVIDEQVSVYIHKDFPAVNEVYLDDFIEKYGLALALLLFGVLITGAGFIVKKF
ncbi:DUF3592 domain-containing protein [uncultured Aquimarina sp.]|uniref:DUF3592 domain-containing protein n=1 Tax=uncultured Aquimarina sp. TaxID=575652 RepID=UPI0026366551|nr:DUF3592 domain-containing protein [uncultured Aquimarina sp.]